MDRRSFIPAALAAPLLSAATQDQPATIPAAAPCPIKAELLATYVDRTSRYADALAAYLDTTVDESIEMAGRTDALWLGGKLCSVAAVALAEHLAEHGR